MVGRYLTGEGRQRIEREERISKVQDEDNKRRKM